MNDSAAHVLCHNAKNLVCTVTSALDIIDMEQPFLEPVVREMLTEIRNAAELLVPMLTELRDLADDAL